ncbi:hypothetical protein BgiMline_009013 [Biomphalaria glabrata]|uniref:Uncharacterized protein LOC129925149 n=1 Tax=Biomphalaria glabrata TaxID=6526 RepID=A0A9W2ZXI2_BIOGL|nr:uncharacterized protein LOC129925149 [Biomphalaria glabrata]KAI8735318.1 hypothetical protein BgiMline_027588 [Biomphalaria glabrata]KAI8784601.1 hypothetical protein BgiBS90_014128 [Biomphalaria glabrata]
MLKWTSKGSLTSDDVVSSTMPQDLPWHNIHAVEDGRLRRNEPGSRTLSERAGLRRLQNIVTNADEMKNKHSMVSEPNSPYCSTEDVRNVRSLSLPSSPLTKKKNKSGVMKKIKNIFRKGRSDRYESPGLLNNKELKPLTEKTGSKEKKEPPKTRLTRLIETKRAQRKFRQVADGSHYALGESRSFLSPSVSSDDEGNYQTSLYNEQTHKPLATFTVPRVDGFAARKDSTLNTLHSTDESEQYAKRPAETHTKGVTRIIEEPKVIARIIPDFHDETVKPIIDPLHSFGDIKTCQVVHRDVNEDTLPVKVESFILDGKRYDFLCSPVPQQPQKWSPSEKLKGKLGSNGIRKSPQGRHEDSSSLVSVSSTSVKDLVRSLSFIKETGSMEKVKVIFSSPESIISARASLCPINSNRQSPSSISSSSQPHRVEADDLYTDNDEPWSSQEEDQTILLPHNDTGENIYYKKAVETDNGNNHQIPFCTRNNNNGHHTSPLVSSSTFCDSPPDVNGSIRPKNIFKSDPMLDSFSREARKDLNYSENSFEMRPSPSQFIRKGKFAASSPMRKQDISGSESDSRSSPLDINHQSLLAIRPKKVKDIVEQIEKESLNSSARFSPIESVMEKQSKETDFVRHSEKNKTHNGDIVQDGTPDSCHVTSNRPEHFSSSSDTEPDAEREYSIEDNFSFSLDEDSYRKSDVDTKRDDAEKELTSPESSSFHLSENLPDDRSTFTSDNNVFYSDNSDLLTSSVFSKEGEPDEKDKGLSPLVHLVCDTLMNDSCFDANYENDYKLGRQQESASQCVAISLPALTSHVGETSAYHDLNQEENCKEKLFCVIDKDAKVNEDGLKKLTSRCPTVELDIPIHKQKACIDDAEHICIKDKDLMATVCEEGDRLVAADFHTEQEECITDVIAPAMMVILDASTSENVTETPGNKSITSDNKENFLESNVDIENVGGQVTVKTESLVGNETASLVGNETASLVGNETASVVGNDAHENENLGSKEHIFYMPECALQEFKDLTNADEIAKEIKSKKKVSFKLESYSPEESSFSDDRAVVETTFHQRQGQSLGENQIQSQCQVSQSEARESASSTDVSVTELSVRSNEIADMPTPSGDDFSWWGAENIDDIDFFHDQSFGAEHEEAPPQDTDVAPSSATENLLHEHFLATTPEQQEDLIDLREENVCVPSNVLTLSSFITSGSIFNMEENEQRSLLMFVDEQQECKENSPVPFDDTGSSPSDIHTGNKSVNKQNEMFEDPTQNRESVTLKNGTCDSVRDQRIDDEAHQMDIDQTSDINTHTYNVNKIETAVEKEVQPWWEEHSGASPTNDSSGSFEISSQDESNTLSELYNQVKNSRPIVNQMKLARKVFKKSNKSHVKPVTERKQSKSKHPDYDLKPKTRSAKTKSNVKRQPTPVADEYLPETELPKAESKKEIFGSHKNPTDFTGSLSSREDSKRIRNFDKTKGNKSDELDMNEVDRDLMSDASQSKWTDRSHYILDGALANKHMDRSPSEWTHDNQNLRPVQKETSEEDKMRSVIRISSTRSPSRTMSSDSRSTTSNSQFVSDEDIPRIIYSNTSYFTENLNERKNTYQSQGGPDSDSSISQYISESCVIDKFIEDSSSQETSSGQTDSNIIDYIDTNYTLQSTFDQTSDKSSSRYAVRYSDSTRSFQTQMGVATSESRYSPNDNMDRVLKYSPHTEAQRHNVVMSSACNLNEEYQSGRSITLAVAESDTTAATNLLSTERTQLNMSHSSAFRYVQGHQFSDPSVNIGQNRQMLPIPQPGISNAAAEQSTGHYQTNEYNDQQAAQQQSRIQRFGQGQLNRSRLTCTGVGDIASAQHSKRSSQDSSYPTSVIGEAVELKPKPGNWLFIASFFIFQLFIHWMYAA